MRREEEMMPHAWGTRLTSMKRRKRRRRRGEFLSSGVASSRSPSGQTKPPNFLCGSVLGQICVFRSPFHFHLTSCVIFIERKDTILFFSVSSLGYASRRIPHHFGRRSNHLRSFRTSIHYDSVFPFLLPVSVLLLLSLFPLNTWWIKPRERNFFALSSKASFPASQLVNPCCVYVRTVTIVPLSNSQSYKSSQQFVILSLEKSNQNVASVQTKEMVLLRSEAASSAATRLMAYAHSTSSALHPGRNGGWDSCSPEGDDWGVQVSDWPLQTCNPPMHVSYYYGHQPVLPTCMCIADGQLGCQPASWFVSMRFDLTHDWFDVDRLELRCCWWAQEPSE